MEFEDPIIFVFVSILFLVGGCYSWWLRKTQQTVALKIPVFDDLIAAEKKAPFFSLDRVIKYSEWVFFFLTIVFLSVALARPQTISEEKTIMKNGVDILIALDVSESMLAEDLLPNRMEAAKKYIDDFVSQLEGDRVGLLVFAGKPFTQSPMTFDFEVIRYYLAEISTDTIDQKRRGLSGTAIGDAIISAINRFQNTQDERTKVLILLTDGEANVGVDPLFAAEHARTNGIKIYTIGLGKKEGSYIPIGTKNGEKVYARNPDGSLFKSAFDEETLKNIAQVSKGKYFFAGDNSALQKSFETINTLEKKEYESEMVITREDRFWIWLLLGFFTCISAIGFRFYSIFRT